MERTSNITRTTKETDISISFALDGSGNAELATGVGFFDHMLDGFTRHGLFDLSCKVKGDLHVDCYHTIEDTGIVLGQAIKEAIGDKKGMVRFGTCILPMDEALVLCSLDLSGRPYYMSDASFTTPMVGDFDTQMVQEFFYAVSYSAGMNLHFRILSGSNSHHIAEGIFKAIARVMGKATEIDEKYKDEIPSTKGVL